MSARALKKIVIDGRESGTTTGRYIDKLIEHLHKLRPKYDIIVLTKTPRIAYMTKIAPRFTVVASDYEEFGFAEQTRFMWQLYRLKADLVHFGMTQQPILYFGHVVTTIHDLTTLRFRNPAKNRLVFAIKRWVYAWVIKIAARKSRFVITPSEFVKDDVAKYARLNSRKIFVTYEAADPITDKSEPMPELENTKFIMYVGRPLPHKNLRRLISAFVELREKQPELTLVLVGKKDTLYKRHERRIKREGIENVIFTDFVSEGQLRWLYEHCAAYVFPSLSEGFGLPGLEAMAAGAPVVSSNATCLPEIYGIAAEYFDPLDVQDMVGKIRKVLTNDNRRKELVREGKKQANRYAWKKTTDQTLAVYQAALGEK